jgi:pimeloyl-ACP methyl ester carboxylesterase
MSLVAHGPLPAGVLARRVSIGGGALAALEAEAQGAHRGTVLLVPGFTGSKEDFREILVPVAQEGFRVVAIDQRGQHESPGPDDHQAYTTAALGADLHQVVQALDDGPVHLVGHSFGGLVSRAAVLQKPSAFQSFVLMDSGPAGLTGPRADVLPFMKAILLEGGMEALWDAAEAVATVDPRKPVAPPEAKAFLKQRMLASSPEGLLGMAESLTGEPDRCAELAATQIPLLVLYGEDDDAWHPSTQHDMAVRLGAPVVVVPGAFHSPAAEQPELTAAALVEFFSSVTA